MPRSFQRGSFVFGGCHSGAFFELLGELPVGGIAAEICNFSDIIVGILQQRDGGQHPLAQNIVTDRKAGLIPEELAEVGGVHANGIGNLRNLKIGTSEIGGNIPERCIKVLLLQCIVLCPIGKRARIDGKGEDAEQAAFHEQIEIGAGMIRIQHLVKNRTYLRQILDVIDLIVIGKSDFPQKICRSAAFEGDPRIYTRVMTAGGKVVQLFAVEKNDISAVDNDTVTPALAGKDKVHSIAAGFFIDDMKIRFTVADTGSPEHQSIILSGLGNIEILEIPI